MKVTQCILCSPVLQTDIICVLSEALLRVILVTIDCRSQSVGDLRRLES